ncbi:MAG: hypothetical protein SGJ19_10450 [Planctomycetia bacterium]|nr:hypothetical protein [Planctomycetia bacterium]
MISPTEILALAIAFALSGAIAWAGWRWLPECRRGVVSLLAVAVAYAAGYFLLAYDDAIPPTRHFHWPPYLVLGAAVVARFAAVPRCPTALRWALYAAAALACAYFLTPTWPALWPPRPICIALLAGYILAVTLAIEPLLRRIDPKTMLAAMIVSLGALAMLITYRVSLVYGIFALLAAAAFAGYAAVAWRKADQVPLAGLALLYAVLACGWAFIGCIEPRPAAPGLLIAPFAPLAFAGAVAGSYRERRFALQIGAAFAILAASAAWVIVT